MRFYVILHRANAGEQRAHHPRLLGLVIGLTGDLRLGAARGLHGGAGRAGAGLGALYYGATSHRARRALTYLTRLVARADTRWARRNRGLQDILRHVGRGRALGLQHVAAHIGLRRARRNTGLQDIFGPVNLGAYLAVGVVGRGHRRCAGAGARATADFTCALRHDDKTLHYAAAAERVADDQAE